MDEAINLPIIMIPPAFDILKKFIGPRDKSVDGRLADHDWTPSVRHFQFVNLKHLKTYSPDQESDRR